MAITSTGLGSGLDIEGLVAKLVAAERDPVVKEVKTKGQTITDKVSALGSVSGALSAFQSAVRSLESSSQYVKPVASSSDSSSVTATVSSAAQIGAHDISISQLAQNQRLKTGSFASADAVVGSGKLIIDFGKITKLDGTAATPDVNGIYDNTNAKFTTNSAKPSATITIDPQHNTLAGVRDAINAAGAPVTASIVYDGSGYRLVLSSTDTGESNSMRITVSDDAGGSVDTTGLSQLAYDVTRPSGTGQNLAEVQSGKSAKLTVDGIAVTSESNTASGVVAGVSFNLLKVTTGSVSVSVGRDPSAASKGIDAFVKSYNDMVKVLKDTSAYDAASKVAAPLQGESVVRTIQSQLRSVLNKTVPGGTFSRLSDIGIGFDKTGQMTYNSATFNAAVTKDAASVATLLGTYGVASDSNVSYYSAAANTVPGKYALTLTQVATQGTLTAGAAPAATTNINLTATNNTFSVTVDGTTSGSLSLSASNYATAGDLALEIQSKINGDAGFKSAGIAVSVNFDSGSGKFVISSSRYGAQSSVAISSISSDLNTALGFSVADTGTAGLDVAGSIGSATATGSGQYLTGAGDANGLKVLVNGGAVGGRGTVSYGKGFAVQLDDVISSMLTKNGVLTSRQNSLNKSLDDLTNQLTKLDTRMQDLEKRYRAQFTALDVTISGLRNTSTYLTQQLAALPSANG